VAQDVPETELNPTSTDMKMKPCTILMAAALVMAAGTTVNAQHIWNEPGGWLGDHFTADTGGGEYAAKELSLDSGITLYSDDRTVNGRVQHGQWGGGFGLNYFLDRNWGLGLDTNISDNGGSFFDYLSFNGLYRYPLGTSRAAPYGMFGFARQFDPIGEWSGHFGGGIEFRLNQITGIFFDARYAITDKSDNFGLFRLGLRLVL
jgi:hypothetical protein